MALVLFRGTFASRRSGFYFGTCWLLLLRLGCCALGVVTTEALGKLASVIACSAIAIAFYFVGLQLSNIVPAKSRATCAMCLEHLPSELRSVC
jgi:hypothetical protein